MQANGKIIRQDRSGDWRRFGHRGFSHGFREGHSPHQALSELRERCRQTDVAWIVDADVEGFFDNLDWGSLLGIIKQRVNNGGILRLIGKWLNYLHHVLDAWYVREVQSRLRGRSFLVRFADDFAVGCEWEDGAQKVMGVLPKRFGRFKLTIHPTKTTLVRFRKPASRTEVDRGNGSFDFLGFTHYWG